METLLLVLIFVACWVSIVLFVNLCAQRTALNMRRSSKSAVQYYVVVRFPLWDDFVSRSVPS